jgi:hypothetical protein
MQIKPGTKVKLTDDVQQKRDNVILGITRYFFDTDPVYTVDRFEGFHQRHTDNQQERFWRLSGGKVRPMDNQSVEMDIHELMIPESALIIQE